MAASHVGDPCPAAEPVDDAVERGQPRGHQVGLVAGPDEALAPGVHVVVVLVPAEPVAGAGGFEDPRGIADGAVGDLEEAR